MIVHITRAPLFLHCFRRSTRLSNPATHQALRRSGSLEIFCCMEERRALVVVGYLSRPVLSCPSKLPRAFFFFEKIFATKKKMKTPVSCCSSVSLSQTQQCAYIGSYCIDSRHGSRRAGAVGSTSWIYYPARVRQLATLFRGTRHIVPSLPVVSRKERGARQRTSTNPSRVCVFLSTFFLPVLVHFFFFFFDRKIVHEKIRKSK